MRKLILNIVKYFFYISLIQLILTCKESPSRLKKVLEKQEFTIEKEVSDSKIEAYLQEMIFEEHFTGVALVIKKNEIVHAKGYGEANSQMKNSVSTKFHIASLTKQFTATAILQLVEKGIVDLNKSVNNYLPQIYRTLNWDNVTIHHILNHTSGIPDYGVTRDYYDVVNGFCLGNTVHGMVKESMAKELEFKPGSKFSYSNIGYTLLGFVIENLTNIPYNKYLNDNIFDPMGMTSSKIHVIGHISHKDEANGYRWSKEKSMHVPDDVVSLPVTEPDGGLITTLDDFTKWIGIYLDKKQSILSQESIKMMSSTLSKIDENGIRGNSRFYGYGLILSDDLICHEGYIVGFRSYFIVDPKKELFIALFSNNTTNNPKRISAGILNIMKISD